MSDPFETETYKKEKQGFPEPDSCKECSSEAPMIFVTGVYSSGTPNAQPGWICDDCGFITLKDK